MHLTWCMAEREGFEPSIPLLAGYTISNRAPSASRASLHFKRYAYSAKRLAFFIQSGALNHERFRARHAPYVVHGGEGGIRTHVPRSSGTAFRERRLKPTRQPLLDFAPGEIPFTFEPWTFLLLSPNSKPLKSSSP